MIIYAISDTHGILPDLTHITDSIIVHAGDICKTYKIFDKERNALLQLDWMQQEFIPWCNQLRKLNNDIVCIAGNHDGVLEQDSTKTVLEQLFINNKIHYLNETAKRIRGINFFGTPFSHSVDKWNILSFISNMSDMKFFRGKIPKETDIIVSHCPVKNILDRGIGCKQLLNRILYLSNYHLKYVIHGHIHEYGGLVRKIANVSVINAANVIKEIQWNYSQNLKR